LIEGFRHWKRMKILLVEDEKSMADVLRKGLEEESYDVSAVTDGKSALALAESTSFDLILLDVMLPGLNGIDCARQLRASRQDTPILMLTARDSVPDIVQGLDAGADDYMTKPFSLAVLLARIRALGRRSAESRSALLRVADLTLNVAERSASRGARELHLTPTEFKLLEFLMRQEGRVASRHAIQDAVWGPIEIVEENTLDVFMRLLRRKVDQDEPVKLIHTLRGFGYALQPESAQ
jgi:DNA-binding response OmpR family regulator